MAKSSKKSPDQVTPPVDPTTATPDGSPPDESSAPAVSSAASVEDVIALAPAAETPDVAAAVASLEPPAPGGPLPAGQTGDIVSPAAADPVKDPKRWGDKRIRRATKAQLQKRVRELQDAPPPAPVAEAIPATPVDSSEVTQLLENVFPGVDALLVFAGGKDFAAKPDELRLLAKTFTPPLLPHYETLKARIPWLPAIGATLGVYVPKVVARMKAAQEAGQVTPAPTTTLPAEPSAAPLELVPVQEPAAIPAPAGLDSHTMPYGGPNE